MNILLRTIYPHLLYCSTLWGNANNELITCLLKLQKRAARLILEQPTEVPSIVRFRKLNWIPIFNLIKMKKNIDGIQYFKNVLAAGSS